ncbi:hypothetical protein KFK09_011206 [Dendrobium nobile]|uniref:Uncharacterized protein n=1 Tax=Dendrobium nobile TaxID=94219 RepID=A0A8T3BHN3_DENNO|nr:hypothetical protein KFK09_011206 [Dendrobium nobile]
MYKLSLCFTLENVYFDYVLVDDTYLIDKYELFSNQITINLLHFLNSAYSHSIFAFFLLFCEETLSLAHALISGSFWMGASKWARLGQVYLDSTVETPHCIAEWLHISTHI